jgi:hypothetical protein
LARYRVPFLSHVLQLSPCFLFTFHGGIRMMSDLYMPVLAGATSNGCQGCSAGSEGPSFLDLLGSSGREAQDWLGQMARPPPGFTLQNACKISVSHPSLLPDSSTSLPANCLYQRDFAPSWVEAGHGHKRILATLITHKLPL